MVGNKVAAKYAGHNTNHPSPKPWKQRKKRSQSQEAVHEVEIFEGKPAIVRPSLLELTSAENGYIWIVCMNEHSFLVPSKVVDSFKCIDVILHSEVTFKERLENVIRFPDMPPEVLETLLRFVFIDYLNKMKTEKYYGTESPRIIFQFEVSPEQVMSLIQAAHFLGVKHLLSVASTMVAHNLKNVLDLSSLPPDLGWCIAEQLSAQDLFDAEERPDFLSLNLGTESLWERHCKMLLQDDLIQPVSSCHTYPSHDTWDAHHGPPPTSWKSLYMTAYLQHLADRQNGCDTESFMDEVSRKGKHAYCHTIRINFWNWVVNGNIPLFFTYAGSFNNLLKLCLVKLPLGTASGDSTLACSGLGKLLESLPLLMCFDISEADMPAHGAVSLSQGLINHKCIQVLCMAFNRIGTQGFIAIIRAIVSARKLKVLDIRHNSIGAWVPQDVVDALEDNYLEELLLQGNFKPVNNYTSNAKLQVEEKSELGYLSIFDVSLNVLVTSGLPRRLKHLQLSQCELTDVKIKVLVSALSTVGNMQKLDLSDNKITSEGAILICNWMQDNDTLLEVNFCNNNITDCCALPLRDAIRSHPTLHKISLMGNYTYSESNLYEVLNAAIERGVSLQQGVKPMRFSLDLHSTDISHGTRGRVLRDETLHIYVDLVI